MSSVPYCTVTPCIHGNTKRTPSPKVKSATIQSTLAKTCRENWKMIFQKFFAKVFNKVYLFVVLFSSFDPVR